MNLNRRHFLQTVAGVTATVAWAEPELKPAKIIDTHAHFYDPTRAQGVPWPPKDDALLLGPACGRAVARGRNR